MLSIDAQKYYLINKTEEIERKAVSFKKCKQCPLFAHPFGFLLLHMQYTKRKYIRLEWKFENMLNV